MVSWGEDSHSRKRHSLLSPLGWHPGICHFHSPHQPAHCRAGARTGSGKHEAMGSDVCCWSGRRLHRTPGGRTPLQGGPHRHGNKEVKEERAGMEILDCHRQTERLMGRERKQVISNSQVPWMNMATSCAGRSDSMHRAFWNTRSVIMLHLLDTHHSGRARVWSSWR